MNKNILLNHYVIMSLLGKGAFAEVYIAEDKKNNLYALKVEDKQKKTKILKEYNVYKHIQHLKHIPKLYSFIETTDYNILVMELMSVNLDELLQMYQKFDLNTVVNIAYNVINIIKDLHLVGYIHRDIKPNNFLVGRKDKVNKIYIMDFGLSKQYMINNEHVPETKINSLVGTPRYASINVHNGLDPTRRDDLESIGYMLIYFINGSLPWQGIKNVNKKDMHEQIRILKINTSIETLTQNLPDCFSQYFKYVKTLKYDEEPNYNYLQELFIKYITTKNKYIWN